MRWVPFFLLIALGSASIVRAFLVSPEATMLAICGTVIMSTWVRAANREIRRDRS